MPRCLPRLLLPALLGLPSFFAVVCPGAATLFLGGENDFNAAMPAAFAFAALMGWLLCLAVDSPVGYVCLETEFVDGASDFFAAMHAAIAFAALMGWPSCFAVDSPAVLAALSGVCALLCCAFRDSASFACACCDAVLDCAFRWLWWVCLLR